MVHIHSNTFFNYQGGNDDYETWRKFSLQNIAEECHYHYTCGYDQLFINKITALHEQDDKNGWIDYDCGSYGTLRLTMTDGEIEYSQEWQDYFASNEGRPWAANNNNVGWIEEQYLNMPVEDEGFDMYD